MSGKMSRADYARSMLESAYDLGSIGVGVQRQLVKLMALNPAEIRNRNYLKDALQAGTQSNLIASAANFAEQTFSQDGVIEVRSGLQLLGNGYRELEARLLRTLANGTNYADSNRGQLTEEEAARMLEALSQRGYFSKAPSQEAAKNFLTRGIGIKFLFDLDREGVESDHQRIYGDMEDLMLGDARMDSIGFHSVKLRKMATIVDLAYLSLINEVEASGYLSWLSDFMSREPKFNQRWKELFNEDLPSPFELKTSAMKVADGMSEFAEQ